MRKRKSEPLLKSKLDTLTNQLDSLYLALGRSVIKVEEMRGAVKKGAIEELRVTAFQLKEHVQKLQKLQREIFSELDNMRVFGWRAQPRRFTGRRVRASADKRKPVSRRQ